jgi:predicted alpha/beta-fold hydrolase
MSEERKLAVDTVFGDPLARGPEVDIGEFIPRRFLSNGHVQTLVGNFLPRKQSLPEGEARIVEVDPGDASMPPSHVLCYCHWQQDASRRPTMLIVHGLEGSSSSQYVVGNAARAWSAGYNVVRMNMRNCGGTDHLSPTLYHSGLSADVDVVMRTLAAEKHLAAFALVGYSMGGNLVLKLAGDLGQAAPHYLKAVVGISPVMDLAVSADALHWPQNRVYEWKFMRGLLLRFRRKVELFPVIYSAKGVETIRTIRQFDDRITARYSGFQGADDYYARAASSRVADRIAVPALVLHSLDDPFIKMLPSTREALRANPHVTLVETAHGGHCAFLAPAVGYDGYWAEKALLGFVSSRVSSGMNGGTAKL